MSDSTLGRARTLCFAPTQQNVLDHPSPSLPHPCGGSGILRPMPSSGRRSADNQLGLVLAVGGMGEGGGGEGGRTGTEEL